VTRKKDHQKNHSWKKLYHRKLQKKEKQRSRGTSTAVEKEGVGGEGGGSGGLVDYGG